MFIFDLFNKNLPLLARPREAPIEKAIAAPASRPKSSPSTTDVGDGAVIRLRNKHSAKEAKYLVGLCIIIIPSIQ